MYRRQLDISQSGRETCFLWGARQTGKSTLLRETFPNAIRHDLLLSDDYRRFTQRPETFRLECLDALSRGAALPIIVDEIQKVPDLLDEVHWLIENARATFVLCGSSARKLRRNHANLLGGRAIRRELFPLVYPEIPDFDLERALNHGLLPPHYAHDAPGERLRAYVGDYLREEIAAEALTRNLPAFSRFLELAALSNGELVESKTIARDCGVSAPTVRSYYEILEDTLLGRFLPSFQKRPKRRVIQAPKFYLFDIGVTAALTRRGRVEIGSELFGRAFEHYIWMELCAHASYSKLLYPISFWRTASQIEVDFVLGSHEVAIEVKSTTSANAADWKNLERFAEEYETKRRIVVSLDPRPRFIKGNLEVLPWRDFLEQLWSGKII